MSDTTQRTLDLLREEWTRDLLEAGQMLYDRLRDGHGPYDRAALEAWERAAAAAGKQSDD